MNRSSCFGPTRRLDPGTGLAGLWALGCLLIAGLSGCEPLVGGECLAGYVEDGTSCVLASAGGSAAGGNLGGTAGTGGSQAGGHHTGGWTGGGQPGGNNAGGTGGANAGGSGAGGGCQPPLVNCGGQCVDTQTNFSHCGWCFHYCPTEVCVDGECTGGPTGHFVIIGMDYQQSHVPTKTLLGNSVFLSSDDPVRILDFRQYAGSAQAAAINNIIASEATARNRTYGLQSVSFVSLLPTMLASGDYDVFLFHHQASAPSGVLANMGASLAAPLASFAETGGVTVVLATNVGTSEMADFLTTANILATTGFTDVTGQLGYNQALIDAVGVGVQAPFLAKPTTCSLATTEQPGPTLSYVLVTAAAEPLVVHRVTAK